MKLIKLVWHFSNFSIIFSEFCKISIFIKKRKTKENEKCLHGLGPAHNEASPTARIQPMSKKKPTKRGPLEFRHFTSGSPTYFKKY